MKYPSLGQLTMKITLLHPGTVVIVNILLMKMRRMNVFVKIVEIKQNQN